MNLWNRIRHLENRADEHRRPLPPELQERLSSSPAVALLESMRAVSAALGTENHGELLTLSDRYRDAAAELADIVGNLEQREGK